MSWVTERGPLYEARLREMAAELRHEGWVMLSPDDFTVENYHLDPYFRSAVDRVVAWWQHPEPPKVDPERIKHLLSVPIELPAWEEDTKPFTEETS